MQKFSFHTHTNTLGIFDGANSIEEMIAKAQEIGYRQLGISNHFIYHPNMAPQMADNHPMYFKDYDKAEYSMLQTAELIREAAANSKIEVYVGFEVDYFPSAAWRKTFEKFLARSEVDYFIGSTHFLKDKTEQNIHSFYYPKGVGPALSKEYLEMGVNKYWDDIVSAIESGYFNFIAHLDVINLFAYLEGFGSDDGKWRVIEALDKYKHPYELNTSGWTKIGIQHPDTWIIEELNRRDVPLVISDDAHHINQLGRHYDQAESLLASLNYKQRWCFK